MITGQSNKSAAKGSSEQKSSQGKIQKNPDGQSEKKKDPPPPPQFTALNITYDRLMPIIRDLPNFEWPPPMRAGPNQRNRSLRCDYHKDPWPRNQSLPEPQISGRKTYSSRAPQTVPKVANPRDNSRSHSR